jgi:hypothetical protein
VRRFLILALLLIAPVVRAGEGRVIKVLPQFLDSKGRHALSPSLYERDAYQFILRKSPTKRAALRLAIQWKAKNVDWSKLRLRAEMRGLIEDNLHSVTLEEPVKKTGHFSNWAELKIEGAAYRDFGQLMAWRVTLLEGDRQLGQMQSFLWSGVTGHEALPEPPAPRRPL